MTSESDGYWAGVASGFIAPIPLIRTDWNPPGTFDSSSYTLLKRTNLPRCPNSIRSGI